jgi:glycosyltransferase involved in cell wall biosynthesis
MDLDNKILFLAQEKRSCVTDYRTGKMYDNMPLVTIGVLSYNYARYIQLALESLLTQTYPFIELIIIDDHSTDTSVDIIKDWIASHNIICTFIQNEKNYGITKVSNQIVNLAKGKYLNLFATDDIMLPEKIERQVALLEEAGEQYGMCYANVDTMDEEGLPLGLNVQNKEAFFPEGDVLSDYINRRFLFATPSGLIRKSVYEKVGMYDERVLIEDYNFWLRLFACYKVKYCSYPCLIYRKKKHSEIFDKWNANNNERYYRDRIISNFEGLRLIKNPEVRSFLKSKISQYLKSLYVYKSKHAQEMTIFLLKKGYYSIPIRPIVRKLLYN